MYVVKLCGKNDVEFKFPIDLYNHPKKEKCEEWMKTYRYQFPWANTKIVCQASMAN
jgi:hypothetical protein